jgi:hypothetical protein
MHGIFPALDFQIIGGEMIFTGRMIWDNIKNPKRAVPLKHAGAGFYCLQVIEYSQTLRIGYLVALAEDLEDAWNWAATGDPDYVMELAPRSQRTAVIR